jgi:hypothetical protein
MKRTFIYITMAAAFSACGHRASTATDANADSVSIDSTKVDSVVAETKRALAIDTINIERSDSMAEVSMTIQWPTGGDEALVKSVRAFICDVCGIKDKAFKGTKADFKDIVDTEYNGLVESWNGTYNGESGPSFTSATEVVQLAETPTFVTFYGESSSYTGGAHGMAVHVGRSFRKSDGKAIGYETDMDDHFNIVHKGDNLLKDTKSPKLYALIKTGVLSYFKECGQAMADDAELADFLQVDDINRIPLPANTPYFSETGVVFCYTQYEIAPYAAGMITFEIPFAKISPFLTDEAKALIKQ